MRNIFLSAFILVQFVSSTAFSKANVQEEVYIEDPSRKYLHFFLMQKELTIDHMSREGYEVYGPKGLQLRLQRSGISSVQNHVHTNLSDYPSAEEINETLIRIQEKNPNITQLFSIGKSTEGRPLYVMKISDNVSTDELEPEFKYIANMHGDEIAGRQLMIMLLEYLVEQYNKDPQITNLINNTEIFIMPSMNPDGANARQRGNGNYSDLNRDFPDFSTTDNTNTSDNREAETKAVMQWQSSRNFSLSANFHGGAQVVNYPWDTIPENFPFYNLVKDLSLEYSRLNPMIKDSTDFQDGITNGYEWYEVNGGMQDWSYYWHNDLQLTVELTDMKWPSYSEIPQVFEANKESLLAYISRIHQGAGFAFQEDKNISGTVQIHKRAPSSYESLGNYQFHNSEFYKVLDPGSYVFEVETQHGKQFIEADVIATPSTGIQSRYKRL